MKKPKKKEKMIIKLEKIIDEMLDGIEGLTPDQLLTRQNCAKIAIDFLNMKHKVSEDDEAGSMFREEEQQ